MGSFAPSSDPRYRFFPELGAPENFILEYRDRQINPWSMFRNQYMGMAGLGIHYYLGHQWSELDPSIAFEGVRGAFIREMDDEDTGGIAVRPVDNIIDPGVEGEVIALVKRQWVPKVVALTDDPDMKAAAQVAHDRLNYLLETLQWREKRHRHSLHYALTGTGLFYTACDKSYFDLKAAPAPYAARCTSPTCGTRLYSPDVPVQLLQRGIPNPAGGFDPARHLETAKMVPPDETQVGIEEATLSYCPTCPTPTPLESYTPTQEEAEFGVDLFGRSLGVDLPKANPAIEVDLPFEFYPQNSGVMVTPDTMQRWGRRKVRELEWIEERYPHLVHLIDPEPVSTLLYGDPIFGSAGVFEGWSPAFDAGVLDHHANVDELVQLPSFQHPDGRYVVCTKDRVLEDSPLLEKVTAEDGEELEVPRVRMSASRFKLRPNVFWGTSIVQHEIPKQNRLNGLDAQLITARLQFMSPNIALPEDMWPDEGPTQDDTWGMGKILKMKPSTSNPTVTKPEIIGGFTVPADGWIPERNAILASSEKSMGPNAAVRGMAPGKGIGTTSGLQLLVEQDDRARSLREDELVNAVELGWGHLLEIEWVLKSDDPDIYKVMGPNDAWKVEQYKGSMLRGNCEVKIERSTFIGRSIVQREAAREALADQVVVIDGPVTRRRLKEMYGLDTNLNEEQGNQVDHAEKLWVDFVKRGHVPVQDPIDNPAIHHEVLTNHLRTDEGERMAKDAGWDEVQRAIAGWEDEMRIMVKQEAESFAFYGGRPTGAEAEDAYTKATIAYQAKKKLYEQQQQVAAALTATPIVKDPVTGEPTAAPPAVPPADPPQPPPVPVQLPQLLQDRVYMLWEGMFKKVSGRGFELPPGPDAAVTTRRSPTIYIKLRALDTAYKMSMAAVMPAPAPAAGAGKPPMPAPTAPLPEGGAH